MPCVSMNFCNASRFSKQKDTFDFDLNKLRIYLDCTNKLEDFRNFERTVLKKAEKEINEKTNIKMSYKK